MAAASSSINPSGGIGSFFDDIYNLLSRSYMIEFVCTIGTDGKRESSKFLQAPVALLVCASERFKEMYDASKNLKNWGCAVKLYNADYEAWQVFFYWLLKKELPRQIHEDQELLVRSWALGEDLENRDFMADIMYRLLRYFHCNKFRVSITAAKTAFCKTKVNVLDVEGKPAASSYKHIRRLFAEELIKVGVADDKDAWENFIYKLPGCECDEGHANCRLVELPGVLRYIKLLYDDFPALLNNRFILGDSTGDSDWMLRMDGVKCHNIRRLVRARTHHLLSTKEQQEQMLAQGSILILEEITELEQTTG